MPLKCCLWTASSRVIGCIKMAQIIDTHAHYTDEAFDVDRLALLAEMPQKGVSHIVTAGSGMGSSAMAVELSHRFPFVYAAVGIHPGELDDITEEYTTQLATWYADEKVIAIGELGLDYHYEDGFPRELQLQRLEQQLQLAKELDAPVIFHDRDAHADTLEILKKYRPKGVVHCFSGSAEMAQEIVALGMFIGLGGAVTFKGAKRPLSVAASVPLDRLVLETDCPYMAPVPHRGHRNDSSLIVHVADVIAPLRGLTVDELLTVTGQNAFALFPKMK